MRQDPDVPREVDEELSAYIVELLKIRRAEFDSQNKMAKAIPMAGGVLSAILKGKDKEGKGKGIGVVTLKKIEKFLSKSRAELEAGAKARLRRSNPVPMRDPATEEIIDAAAKSVLNTRRRTKMREAEAAAIKGLEFAIEQGDEINVPTVSSLALALVLARHGELLLDSLKSALGSPDGSGPVPTFREGGRQREPHRK